MHEIIRWLLGDSQNEEIPKQIATCLRHIVLLLQECNLKGNLQVSILQGWLLWLISLTKSPRSFIYNFFGQDACSLTCIASWLPKGWIFVSHVEQEEGLWKLQSFCINNVFKLTEWVKGDCFGCLFLEREKGMTEWYIRYQSCFDCEFSEQKKMAEWYIRGSSSSHQLITLDSDSFPPLLIRFLWWSWWSWGRSWWGMCGWVWVWWRSGWRSGSGSRSNDSQSISSLARAAAVAFALFGAGLLYYEHLNRFIMTIMMLRWLWWWWWQQWWWWYQIFT